MPCCGCSSLLFHTASSNHLSPSLAHCSTPSLHLNFLRGFDIVFNLCCIHIPALTPGNHKCTLDPTKKQCDHYDRWVQCEERSYLTHERRCKEHRVQNPNQARKAATFALGVYESEREINRIKSYHFFQLFTHKFGLPNFSYCSNSRAVNF